MSKTKEPANDAEEIPIDDEIAALLEFEPVPRAYKQRGAWTPELQRLFIARLAVRGSVNKACDDLNKDPGGIRRLKRAPGSDSFRASWDAAEELWERRNPPLPPEPFEEKRRRKKGLHAVPLPPAGEGAARQVPNEYGEHEDEGSFRSRAEDARDSIAGKLLRIRRLYLQQISGSPGKRAAFEILTELPVDWDKAERGEPQPDEPYNRGNPRQPDMILTAESGWAFGEIGYGPDRKAEMRRAIDKHRAAEGLPPVNWSEGE